MGFCQILGLLTNSSKIRAEFIGNSCFIRHLISIQNKSVRYGPFAMFTTRYSVQYLPRFSYIIMISCQQVVIICMLGMFLMILYMYILRYLKYRSYDILSLDLPTVFLYIRSRFLNDFMSPGVIHGSRTIDLCDISVLFTGMYSSISTLKCWMNAS